MIYFHSILQEFLTNERFLLMFQFLLYFCYIHFIIANIITGSHKVATALSQKIV
jgi:hypothetical protein